MDVSTFKKLGLSDKEIKVYLKLLEHGATSVRGLAYVSGLNRGTIYDILKKLQKDGLVSYYHHETKQKFVAEKPEGLIKLASDKEDEIKKIKIEVEKIIPELKSLQQKEKSRPTTKFYEGNTGIRFILDDIIDSVSKFKDKEYFVYSSAMVREEIYAAFPEYNKKRIKNKIIAKTISLSSGGSTYGLDERRWLKTKETVDHQVTYILIYAGKCAFISKDVSGNLIGVIIENKMIYETQKIIFTQLWTLLN